LWVLQSGETVSAALARWAAQTGRALIWDLTLDVPIQREKRYDGALGSALKQLSTDLKSVLPVVIQYDMSFIQVKPLP
jgi:hypothetical protein